MPGYSALLKKLADAKSRLARMAGLKTPPEWVLKTSEPKHLENSPETVAQFKTAVEKARKDLWDLLLSGYNTVVLKLQKEADAYIDKAATDIQKILKDADIKSLGEPAVVLKALQEELSRQSESTRLSFAKSRAKAEDEKSKTAAKADSLTMEVDTESKIEKVEAALSQEEMSKILRAQQKKIETLELAAKARTSPKKQQPQKSKQQPPNRSSSKGKSTKGKKKDKRVSFKHGAGSNKSSLRAEAPSFTPQSLNANVNARGRGRGRGSTAIRGKQGNSGRGRGTGKGRGGHATVPPGTA